MYTKVVMKIFLKKTKKQKYFPIKQPGNNLQLRIKCRHSLLVIFPHIMRSNILFVLISRRFFVMFRRPINFDDNMLCSCLFSQ